MELVDYNTNMIKSVSGADKKTRRSRRGGKSKNAVTPKANENNNNE